MEGAQTPQEPSRAHDLVQLGVLSALTILTALFGLAGLTNLAEVIGPTETRTGRVLERSSFEWKNQVCNFGQSRGSGRPCVEFSTPAGSVTGEFPDGETWVVVNDEGGTSPREVAGPPGSELEVTTSSLTGRVTALDNGSRFEGRWTRARSLGFIATVAAGAFMVAAMTVVLVLRRRHGNSIARVPRPLVVAALALAFSLGAFGAWWGTIRSADQYLAPSSADRYGSIIADPYEFAASSDEAEEAGRSVELNAETTVRALASSEVAADVRDVITVDGRPAVALLSTSLTPSGRLFPLRVLAEDSSGATIEAEPCGELEFPAEIGVDERIAAGLFCFPTDLEPGSIIRVAEGREGTGVPIAAPVLG